MRFFIVCVVAMLLSACNPDAADAGKTCQASSDCEGVCLADGQICSPQAPFYGCHDVYENGVIATLCVD